eukprot:m51a1_g14405 hypothetical protein (634) ;mRNA; r:385631-388034
MSCNTTNTGARTSSTANGNNRTVAALETAWQLRSHVVGRVCGGDLVWLALAFPAALAGPCVAQLRAAHRSACEPPEATDAPACDALVGAVARGRLGDARALLGGPLGPSLLRWRSAGRAAELDGREAGEEEAARDIAEQFVAVVASTRDFEHVDPLAGAPVKLYSGVAPVVDDAHRLTGLSGTDALCSAQSGKQCGACREMLRGLLQSVVAACPNCPGSARLAVISEADLNSDPVSSTVNWWCSMCRSDFCRERARVALDGSLLMRCTCDYKLCCACAMGVAGLMPLDPLQTFMGGLLCGLEAGNECSACHELHRRLLDDSDVRCPLCSQRLHSLLEDEFVHVSGYDRGWICDMCKRLFDPESQRPGVLMMRCTCGYNLCGRCCLGVIGVGFAEGDPIQVVDDGTACWDQLLGKDDWTTKLQQPLPARLFFLACAMGMAQSLRLMVQKPLCFDRASAVNGHHLEYYRDALLFAALSRDGWIEHQQPKAIGRGGFIDVIRAMLQPPLTPAELLRTRMRTLLLWSLRLAEEDVHEIVSILMAPPVSLTAEQCFEDQFFVEKVAESELSMDVLSRSQLGIEQGRWACWLKENGVELQRDLLWTVNGQSVWVNPEEVDRPDYDSRLIEGESLVRLFE